MAPQPAETCALPCRTEPAYRGRLAPSPTGFLHLGHARTFWTAYQRAIERSGTLLLRNEDLDRSRCRPEFTKAMIEDLHWFGIEWQEGPDSGGPFGPYEQSRRQAWYRAVFEQLRAAGFVYPCTCSRQDVLRAARAPHGDEDEPLYPGTCRPDRLEAGPILASRPADRLAKGLVNWRFRVTPGEEIAFRDGRCGPQVFIAGQDFGDFVVWRQDQTPAYQLAVVVDDDAMEVTEVVRGADLLKSTARQLLLYRALELRVPAYYHCPLMTDLRGVRLAKRHEALSLRRLRSEGHSPASIRESWSAAEGQFRENLLEKKCNSGDSEISQA